MNRSHLLVAENTWDPSVKGLRIHSLPNVSLGDEEREVLWILLGPVLNLHKPQELVGPNPKKEQSHISLLRTLTESLA